MGLVKQIELDNGIILNNSYSRIYMINHDVSKDFPFVNIKVQVYYDKNAFDDGKPDVNVFNYKISGEQYNTYFDESVLSQDGVTLLSQCYNFLKSLSIYNGCTEL